MRNDKLLGCPFCGSKANYLDLSVCSDYDRHKIICTFCSVEMEDCKKETVFKEWNTRHTPEGFALVPIKITADMLEELTNGDVRKNTLMKLRYTTMLKAAGDQND